MYQNGTSTELAKEDAAKKAEEYLLGKEYVGEGAIQGDFHDGNQNEGIHSALTKTESVSQQEPRRGEIDSSVAKFQANGVGGIWDSGVLFGAQPVKRGGSGVPIWGS